MRKPRWRQWRNARKDHLVLELAALAQSAQNILSDLGHLPWGVKPRLYAIQGDLMDPTVQLVGHMPSVDLACFVNAYDEGWRVPEGTEGLIYIFEALRYYTFQEMVETPAANEAMRLLFQTAHPNQVDDREAYEVFYITEIVSTLPPPKMLPAHMRKNMRVAIVVLKSGFGLVAHKSQEKDDLDVITFDESRIGDMGGSGPLYQLLHGLRPSGDAVATVKDFKILQEAWAL